MKTRFACMLAGAMLAVGLLGHSAGAQTPSPSADGRADPGRLHRPRARERHRHRPDRSYGGTAQLALAQRASLTRIDVLSVRSDASRSRRSA